MKRDFDNFDEFAEDYRDTHNSAIKLSGADSDYFSEYKIIEVAKNEQHQETLKILDFGCGDGNSVVFFRKHFKESYIEGIDVSQASIDIAADKKIDRTKFQVFDGKIIPYENDSFDIIFTSMVFHHIEHKLHKAIISEIYRVLKPQGRFYMFEHNPYNPLTRRVVDQCEFDRDAVLLKPKYGKQIISLGGFDKFNLNFTIFIPRLKIIQWALRLENYLKWLPIGAQYYIRAIK